MKERHIRDFWTYVRWYRYSNMPFGDNLSFTRGTKGTLACYVDADGRGNLNQSPRHPRLLRAALLGKKLLNLQVREWAQGYCYTGGQYWFAELREDIPWLPDWVYDSILKQYTSVYKDKQKFKCDKCNPF